MTLFMQNKTALTTHNDSISWLQLFVGAMLLVAATFGLSNPSHATTTDKLVADISEHEVALRYSFTGSDLILFGAIDHDDRSISHDAIYDVIINVKGPRLPAVVRKKDKIAGIWVNKDNVTFTDAPSFYIQASTRPLNEITTEDVLRANQIGFAYQNYHYEASDGITNIDGFVKGFIRNKEDAGLYQLVEDHMPLLSKTLFRADVHIPANVPVGDFVAEIFLFKDGQLIATEQSDLVVVKKGFSEVVYNFAHQHPAFYGLMAIMIALMSGWLAGVLVRD